MLNATLDKAKKVLTIEIPFDAKGKASQSGKSKIHATTSGNQAVTIDGDVMMLGVNLYKKV